MHKMKMLSQLLFRALLQWNASFCIPVQHLSFGALASWCADLDTTVGWISTREGVFGTIHTLFEYLTLDGANGVSGRRTVLHTSSRVLIKNCAAGALASWFADLDTTVEWISTREGVFGTIHTLFEYLTLDGANGVSGRRTVLHTSSRVLIKNCAAGALASWFANRRTLDTVQNVVTR